MAEFKLTLVDDNLRRVTRYRGWSAPLLIASKNPRTVKEFEQTHNQVIGRFIGPLYLEQRLSPQTCEDLDKEELRRALSTIELPYPALEGYSFQQLLALAQQPDYKDYSPAQKVGTGIRSKSGCSYDGVLVIDLRTHEISIRGERGVPMDKESKRKAKNEPYYRWFGFLSELRQGHAGFVKAKKSLELEYALDFEWAIIDLRNGRRY